VVAICQKREMLATGYFAMIVYSELITQPTKPRAMNITYIADGQRFTSMFALQKYADSVGEKVLSEERISSSVYKVTLIKIKP